MSTGRSVDLTGQRFARLTVKKPAPPGKYGSRWAVTCDCGTTKVVYGRDLRIGDTKSCGCLKAQKAAERSRARAAPEHLPERFWARVAKTDGDGCWEWQGSRNRAGYGRFGFRQTPTHRLAWELTNGPISDGLFVCHRCDNPPCVRPDHLFLGTHADNMNDMDAKGRRRRGEKHHGWGKPGPGRGENNRHAKLTPAQVEEIRQRYAAGAKRLDLASEYGLHRSTILKIGTGISWKSIPMESV
jgi:hypothetical protein